MLSVLLAVSCAEGVYQEDEPNDDEPRILAMGDSLIAWNRTSGRSIADTVESELGVNVVDRAHSGAFMLYRLPISGALGMDINRQYVSGHWDWVILNGGGNDLWLGCGCRKCSRRLDALVGADGQTGIIPNLVSKLRQNGAKVIYLGYLRTPGVTSPIEHCKNEGDEFERRIDMMSRSDRGVFFLSLAELVPDGDRSYHWIDLIHPSPRASQQIGRLVAGIIREYE